MQSSGTLLLSLALVLLSSTSTASRLSLRAEDDCSDVHIFLARGNNEPYPGRQGKLVAAICDGLPSCDYEDVQYYNPLPAPYCGSVIEGAANGIKQITAYNKRCPKSQLVVSGYSQGAHVVGDVLGGGGGVFFENCEQPSSAGLSPKTAPGNKIAAALIFGDVRHTAGQSYNFLSGAGANGLFPRSGEQLANLNAFSSVFRDYCAAEDPICAGGDVVDVHLNYFDVYSDQAGDWVKSKLALGEDEPESTSAPAAPPKTSSPTKKKTLPITTLTAAITEETESRTEIRTTGFAEPTSTVEGTSPSASTGVSRSSTSSRATKIVQTSPTAAETTLAGETSSEVDEPSQTDDTQTAESSTGSAAESNDSDNAAPVIERFLTSIAFLVMGLLAL